METASLLYEHWWMLGDGVSGGEDCGICCTVPYVFLSYLLLSILFVCINLVWIFVFTEGQIGYFSFEAIYCVQSLLGYHSA